MKQARLQSFIELAIVVVGFAMFLYHMVSTQYLFTGNFEHQDIHLAFILVLIFLGTLAKSGKTWQRALQAGLIVLSLAATGYVFFNLNHLEEVVGFPERMDVLMGVIVIVLVIEATRQAWGMTLPIVATIFVLYFLFGNFLPGALHHEAFSFYYVVSYLSIGLSGIYGLFLSISANQVFLFVVFGSLLGIIKINDFFFELGKGVGRVFQGGPGQTAVVSSALVGMVTGAAVANVAITGAFTIPFMKRVGYRPEIAGAIEATASTGGQIMPPVMGAGAFLMAAFMGVPYAAVMLAAVIPAILYFWCCVLGVQFISVSEGIKAPKETIDKGLIYRRLPLFLIPLCVLIALLVMRYSPSNAAFWTIIVAIALSYLGKETRPNLGELVRCLAGGAVVGAQIGISLAIVGLMAQTLITTGLGGKIAGLVEVFSGGNVLLALILTMVVSIVLGCGIPTSAAYALVAIVVVPGLIRLGVEPMSAHLFAFYFAVISALTPPVALASLAGAGIAGASYFKTSLHAFKLAISGFILPYLIVYNPFITLKVVSWTFAIGTTLAVPIGLTALTALLYDCALVRFNWTDRLLALGITLTMFGYSVFRHIEELPLEYPMLAAGLVLSVILLRSQLLKKRASQPMLADVLPG